jgi:hypothetical protein
MHGTQSAHRSAIDTSHTPPRDQHPRVVGGAIISPQHSDRAIHACLLGASCFDVIRLVTGDYHISMDGCEALTEEILQDCGYSHIKASVEDVVVCFNDIILVHNKVQELWYNAYAHTLGPQVDKILHKSLSVFPKLASLKVDDVIGFYDCLQEVSMGYSLALMPFDAIVLKNRFEGLCPPGLGLIRYASMCKAFKAFAISTTASTVGDDGTPKGSTQLDAICGSNCTMDKDEFRLFAQLLLGLCPGKQHGTEASERSLLNMLLEDFVVISNLTTVFALDKPDDRRTLARRLARFSLLLMGADVITPNIVARVWGENNVVRRNLGGPRGDLAIICRRLVSLASMANNIFHLWLTTPFNGGMIIPPYALQHLPPGVQDFFNLISLPTAAIYVREPLHSGQERIQILQNNLRQSPLNPLSSNFEDIIVGWYRNLLLGGNHSTDTTGLDNHIFAAYGLYPSTT